jgi:hypothetical protein
MSSRDEYPSQGSYSEYHKYVNLVQRLKKLWALLIFILLLPSSYQLSSYFFIEIENKYNETLNIERKTTETIEFDCINQNTIHTNSSKTHCSPDIISSSTIFLDPEQSLIIEGKLYTKLDL